MSVTFSCKVIEARLLELSENSSSGELGYDLLRIFNRMSETRIDRIKNGKDNLSKEPNSFVVKKLLAYSYCTTENMVESLEALKQNHKVIKTVRLLVVSDGETLLGYDPVEKESYENTVDRLRYDYQFFMPLAGVERYHSPQEKEADIKAAYKMARIFDEIRRYNAIDYRDTSAIKALNVFMSRLLFCFFAEDTGIFPDKIFTSTLNDFTLTDGSDLSTIISEAFDIMSTNDSSIRATKPSHISRFPYVNGGLFVEHYDVPALSWKARRLLLECGDLNWAEINPDIFGSMIQAVISPELRSSLGTHYTSVSNIMKLIQPLFLDDLYVEFADGRTNEKRLRRLLARIGHIKFLDPACGSGNFLIITYKELRKLEIQIWEQIENLNHGLREIPFSNISLTQFHGIEIDEYACETATLSLWLAEHQMNRQFESRFQTHVDALPLRQSGNIVCDNACRIDWNTVCPHTSEEEVYIMGNPPYLGYSKQDENQKQDLALCFSSDNENYKKLDYISCWFIIASKFIIGVKQSFAFVSTNSICQGEQVALLWPYVLTNNLEISFAHTSFKWENNAKFNAGVTCINVGVSYKNPNKSKCLYIDGKIKLCKNINSYLIDSSDVFITPLNKSISKLPLMQKGSAPGDGGNLLIDNNIYKDLKSDNDKAIEFIKQFKGADEIVNSTTRYCLWIESDNLESALKIDFIRNRINLCKQFREKSKKAATVEKAKTPYAFDENRYSSSPTIVVPQTTSELRKYIPIIYSDEGVVFSNGVRVIYNGELWLMGVLTSYMHMIWVNLVCGRLETRIQYSNTICYNTFPFPKITEAKQTEIEQAAEDVLMAREQHTEKTLAQMYDPDRMPANLREAHSKLDRVVESCYRTVPFHSDEERLEHLFALYEKMTKKV